MPKPFIELTLDEFKDLVSQFPFSRRIESVHMHHTWRPNHADFAARPGLATIEGMFNFHTQVNHWSDIAQHVTIDPTGKIWTGRSWNAAPASSTGFNGTSAAGPFMFETIGDFDEGRDPFGGEQAKSVIGVMAAVLKRFGLTAESIRFHNQMSPKSCPGSGLKRDTVIEQVREAMAAATTPRSLTAFTDADSALRSRTQKVIEANAGPLPVAPESLAPDAEPGEDSMNANDVAVITGAQLPAAMASRAIFGSGPQFTPEEKQTLRRHVINLQLGLLSDSGAFQTSPADVQRLFGEFLPAEIELQKREGQPLRLVFYAHGGLVSEDAGIRPVLRRLPFWRQNGLYPIFFCWETGLKETIGDLLKSAFSGRRGLVSDATDAVLEAIAGPAGRKVWGQMKRCAELASMQGGGARMVAEMTRDLWAANHADMEIHALGHSAGSIFHAYFLPELLGEPTSAGAPPVSVKSLHFLAPASTTALFESKLMPRIGSGKQIANHTMYTMSQDFEEADTAGPYKKSLLYLVSRAFEDHKPTPILGLEESLRENPGLARFYGLTRVPGSAEILFSKTPPAASPDRATESTSHGDFDNESKTMNSVARRILGQPAASIASFVDESSRNEVSRALAFAPVADSTAAAALGTAVAAGRAIPAGAAKALCIGIDAYPPPNALEGCVNDARDWAATLNALKFDVTLLVNQQATREAILGGMRQIISGAAAGDVVVIQFAGHGTQVQDLDADEQDGLDEALVPVDFGTGAFLIDDDLRGLMLTIPEGVNVTCFMDCCHSGTNTRMLGPTPLAKGGGKARFMKATPEMNQAHVAFRSQRREGPAPSARTSDGMLEINFAACRPDQVAFESDGSGDFTRRALPILRGGIEGLTNEMFLKRMLEAFGAGARQEPVLDCAGPAGLRLLLGPLTARSVDVVGAQAVRAGAPDGVAARLEAIERRLTKLGV